MSRPDEESPLIADRAAPATEVQERGFFVHVKRHGRRGCGFWVLVSLLIAITIIAIKFTTKSLDVEPTYPDGTPRCTSDKSYVVAVLLSGFFGTLGIDRFYLGFVVSGILKLVTAGGFGFWWVIDFILIAVNAIPDSHGCVLKF
ncbi:hypothetical protein HDU96_003934 [Phlyctochytrium bullatum]|nr:hypothetical protein HDU96_003934 [Phlyctochytrium bullatum]